MLFRSHDPSGDTADSTKQYRNRNIKYKHLRGTPNRLVKPADPYDPSPLYFATTTVAAGGGDVTHVAAKEGWYVDITSILEDNDLMRIPRHANWLTNHKSWEWWHYQYEPDPPPGATVDLNFGEYLQLFGVHELNLRTHGWSAHEDIDHRPG